MMVLSQRRLILCMLLFSCQVVSNSLQPQGQQHARPPCIMSLFFTIGKLKIRKFLLNMQIYLKTHPDACDSRSTRSSFS